MTIFLSGGCKNGKSTLAERCAHALSAGGPLYYLATMIPHDGEDLSRIRRHIAARDGLGFITLEQGRNILSCLDRADRGGTFLLDSVTALLSNEMFTPGGIDPEAGRRTASELAQLAGRVKNIVFVSDFIYSDGRGYDAYTELYRRGLALCDRTLGAVCDTVVEVALGQHMIYKGALPRQVQEESTWI